MWSWLLGVVVLVGRREMEANEEGREKGDGCVRLVFWQWYCWTKSIGLALAVFLSSLVFPSYGVFNCHLLASGVSCVGMTCSFGIVFTYVYQGICAHDLQETS